MRVGFDPYSEGEYLNGYDIRDHPAEFCWNPACKCHTQSKEHLDRQVQQGLLTEAEKKNILAGKVI